MKSFRFLIISLLLPIYISGQVTIGSDETPAAGAILQLKQPGSFSNNATATRGLLLPRVALTDRFLLTPMLTGSDLTDLTQNKDHIGLTVYNTNDLYYPYCKGLYVWDGTKWEPFMRKKSVPEPYIVDGEGNKYTYKKIGNKYWLTQNVRTVTVNGEGTTLINKTSDASTIQGIAINPGYQDVTTAGIAVGLSITEPIPNPEMEIEYSEKRVGDNTTTVIKMTRKEFADKFGFLYSQQYSQLACPKEWRLPTETDWNDLFTALGGIAQAGKRMKSDYIEYTSTDGKKVVWDGYSMCSPENSGFNALPSGATNSNTHLSVLHFALNTRWWSEVSKKAYGLDVNAIPANSDKVNVYTNLNAFRYPVRCVRDTSPE